MTYRVSVRKVPSPGGSPLSWDSVSINRLTDNLDDLLLTSGFDTKRVRNAVVLLHPNLVRPHRSRPASFTDPRVILATVELFRRYDAKEIQVGENPGFGFSARRAFFEAGLLEPLTKSGVKLQFFDEGEWVSVPNPNGRLFRDVMIAKPVLETDFFVNIPKMKTHMLTQVSLSIKNLLGIINDDQRILFHRNDIADKVVDLNMVRQPDLNIVDGLWAMEGQAPFHGRTIEEFNLLVAGSHTAAVDSVCCEIMGFSPEEVPHVQLGLNRLLPGWMTQNRLELTGDSIETVRKHFKRPVLSSMGQFHGVECIECGVCNGCLSAIRHSLDWLKDEIDLSELEPVTIVSGRPMPNIKTLDTWTGQLILFGNCAAEFQFFDMARRQKAIWISGCPPHVLDLANLIRERLKRSE
ncbi:DUF362 domain-containing protein [bacterium]|nr:DUF362 domain-containing protein [candidate division CSSED10-310 bacterium]